MGWVLTVVIGGLLWFGGLWLAHKDRSRGRFFVGWLLQLSVCLYSSAMAARWAVPVNGILDLMVAGAVFFLFLIFCLLCTFLTFIYVHGRRGPSF